MKPEITPSIPQKRYSAGPDIVLASSASLSKVDSFSINIMYYILIAKRFASI